MAAELEVRAATLFFAGLAGVDVCLVQCEAERLRTGLFRVFPLHSLSSSPDAGRPSGEAQAPLRCAALYLSLSLYRYGLCTVAQPRIFCSVGLLLLLALALALAAQSSQSIRCNLHPLADMPGLTLSSGLDHTFPPRLGAAWPFRIS